MTNFMSNLLSGGGKGDKPSPLDISPRPTTPSNENQGFLDPISTPQGSPSKKTTVPGAFDLPTAFDGALKLNAPVLESPVKLNRPQSVITPLSPGKSNAQPNEDTSIASVDDSIVHTKGEAVPHLAPLKKQGQENTPPPPRLGIFDPPLHHNHAALSRHEVYQTSRPVTPAKKFNTSRGLTPEELEILQKPHVKRLVNVTQLCTSTCSKAYCTLALT